MCIKILFFGIIRDIVGKGQQEYTVDTNVTISLLKEQLFKSNTNLKKYKNFSVAVNEAYVNDDYVLQPNDIVAIIPPVSGG